MGEHLHRNPSLETSKSSVELEQGMLNRSKTQKTEFYSSEKYEESKQYQSNLVKSTNGQNLRGKEVITNRPAYNPWSAEQEVRETKKQEQSYIVTSTHEHYQTEEMVQSSSARTDFNQKNNFMSYVESAKLKDQHLKSDYESRQNTPKYDGVKVEVNGPVDFKPVARSTSTSSSSSSSSGIKESGHFTSGVSGNKVTRHESDSSMSNEEIVRQHLNQFNEKEQKVVLLKLLGFLLIISFNDLIFRTELHLMALLLLLREERVSTTPSQKNMSTMPSGKMTKQMLLW